MSLILDSVTKRFGDVVALDDASFMIEPGRIFGLLGANGAGKTTKVQPVHDARPHAADRSIHVRNRPGAWAPRRSARWRDLGRSRVHSAGVLLYGQRVGIRSVLRATRVSR
jgi:ABC-type branched-subunit amino acid transport system ATPase component